MKARMKTVDGIKTQDEVRHVEYLLKKHGGTLYADLWCIGVNMPLRVSNLLQLRYEDLERGVYELQECKTGRVGKAGKKMSIVMNDTVMEIVKRRKDEMPSDVYLFQVHSNRTKSLEPKPVSRMSVARKFKDVGEIIGVSLGAHSMRMTYMWAQYSNQAFIKTMSKVSNHTHSTAAMTYSGVTKQE